ncbi:alpha-amylase family glycosyl hydrolase [Petrotoga sp. 9PWA.NaAc.5.4]|uniref:alpha-amylase family glycosyl hydrolase n=1 Tax=Petrotoga sp. 9PWA.NaAc.5.4 TaxID=1434328 RepID=UPI000CB8F0D2|nr:alpha-amylase family glycosyl hydrolase [Petrotoga sp. 9PWA.NaAc.5.4]PNR92418.1 4-alpha-glucanotransferase [Petrotoga sp. 9PWA.NaAc.5.4]
MIFYELYLRSFYDSNEDGLGDLKGLKEKLDYLVELGVDHVWLLPIMKSPAFHGYTVSNFYEVNPVYGNLNDVKEVLSEGHKKGIKFVLDLPINHVAVTSDWFQKALKGEEPYKDWFVWANEKADLNEKRHWDDSKIWQKIGNKYFYGIFGPASPDLYFERKELWQEIKNIFKFWLDAGFDGFRLDAAKHIFDFDTETMRFKYQHEKNVEFWKEMISFIKSIKNEALVISEVWDAPEIVRKYEGIFDIGFNFPIAEDLKTTLKDENTQRFVETLNKCIPEYLPTGKVFSASGNFLTNHDMTRILSDLKSEEKVKLGFSIIYTLPGIPFIYYGEEIGMKGIPIDVNFTEDSQEPFHWYENGFGLGQTEWKGYKFNPPYSGNSYEEQAKDRNSILNIVKNLIKFRKNNSWIDNAKIDILNFDQNVVKLKVYDQLNEIIAYYNLKSSNSSFFLENGTRLLSIGENIIDGKNLKLAPYGVYVVKHK